MISVIIPVYNCEKYIDPMMQSLYNQTYQDFEVVCVNDGSTDGSLNKLMEHQLQHPNLKVVTIQNSGPSMARNRGIDEAEGEYICFIDSDDTITESYLMNLMNALTAHDADMSVSYIERVYEYKQSILEKSFNYIQNYQFDNPSSIEEDHALLVFLMNAPFSKLIRKDFLDRHQIRFIPGRIAQDLLFTKTILLHGAKVAVAPEVDYLYLIRKGSITTGRLDKAYDLAAVYEQIIEVAKQHNQFDKYFEELEYLCLYHLGIDMSFRIFKATKNVFKSVQPARKVMKKYGFNARNKYVKQLNWFAQIYLTLFFSI